MWKVSIKLENGDVVEIDIPSGEKMGDFINILVNKSDISIKCRDDYFYIPHGEISYIAAKEV